MVMQELPKPRKTTVFIKGDFTRPAEEVTPGTPAVLHPFEQPDRPAQPAGSRAVDRQPARIRSRLG